MNKKILPLAALVAMAGAANVAQAVNVNEEGLGEVLVYPFYTVEEGQDTIIALVNTTDDYKAVKVRIREAMNTEEVLDFNVYLSPYDHWSAVITQTAAGGAQIATGDTSCTVPLGLAATATGQVSTGTGDVVPFRNTDYARVDNVNTSVARTAEGYIEVIEMAVVTDATMQAAILHGADGTPGDCGAVDAAWDLNGLWSTAGAVEAPSGGLYGWGAILNIAEGTDIPFDAVALDNWTNGTADHTVPGSTTPNISTGNPAIALYDSNTASFITDTGVANGIVSAGLNAVSAVLMHDTISADYIVGAGIGAATDLVLTFPTKHAYVQGTGLIEPFTSFWNHENTSACEGFNVQFWDREEQTPGETPGTRDYSPLPTPTQVIGEGLCYEANLVTINGSDVLKASDRITNSIASPYSYGWAKLALPGTMAAGTSATTYTYQGLPVIGFTAQTYRRGQADANYAGSYELKTTRKIQ